MCVRASVCAYPSPRLLQLVALHGPHWTPCDWLNKFYRFFMPAVVGIISRHGLSIDACMFIEVFKRTAG